MYVSSLMLVVCLKISRFVVEILFLNFVVDSESFFSCSRAEI